MSSMSEDIQCAGSDTRPPMLDRTDFESWQQRILMYCLGKDNGENIMKSINEGPFHIGTVSDVITGNWGACSTRSRETIQGYYVRFTKLINDMRNIKMTMPRMQLNSKFVNNMLPEWSRFITEVKLNTWFLQPTNDPLALVSNASVHQYPTQSSKSPQSSNEPSLADNFQRDSGTTVQDGRVVVQDVRGRYNANNQGRPYQRNNARGNVIARNVGGGTGYQLCMMMWIISPENDLALNVDMSLKLIECDALDSLYNV
ncbi:hypothetical protein Tco_0032063 [Tanacetum coccineum]